MTDHATIRYPYRTRQGARRWGQWTGSRAKAFTAGSEALGGLACCSLPEGAPARWAYTDAVTKGRWVVSTDDVIMLGAALIARLPPEAEQDPKPTAERRKLLPADLWLKDAVTELASEGVKLTDKPPQRRDIFEELFDAWVDNTPTRREIKP